MTVIPLRGVEVEVAVVMTYARTETELNAGRLRQTNLEDTTDDINRGAQ
jgi:hypothetical protein